MNQKISNRKAYYKINGNIIKQWMAKEGKEAKQIEVECPISHQTLNDILNNKKKEFFLKTVLKIANYTGIPIDALTHSADKPEDNLIRLAFKILEGDAFKELKPNPTKLEPLDYNRIYVLAKEKYRLFTNWKENPHLAYKSGDISYWSEQEHRSEFHLSAEFLSRLVLLWAAEDLAFHFPTQGDLSYYSAHILGFLLKE